MGLNKCCFCVDLRTGAMIIAVLEILGGFSVLGQSYMARYIVTCITLVVSGSCLLFGAIKYNWTATLVNLVFSAIGIVLCIIVTVMLFVAVGTVGMSGQNNAYWTTSIIQCVTWIACVFVKIYFWVCVYSFYKNLKSGNISSSSA